MTQDAQTSLVEPHPPDPRDYPSTVKGRYAGDGIRASRRWLIE